MQHHPTNPRPAFSPALFSNPMARDMLRVGVVDVGSNSVRLVIFDGAARSPAFFYNEKIMCGLGAGLSETGKLNPEGRKRALAALTRFQTLGENLGIAPLSVVATAAVREAKDGPEFCAEVQRKTGMEICVIDGAEEARLSAQGVLLGWPGSRGLVCDIGGSSMELAEIDNGDIGKCVTSSLGPLKLRDVKGGKRGRKAHIREAVEKLAENMPQRGGQLFLVGGSWRAIARVDMERLNYPLHVQHEYRMSPKAVRATLRYLEEADHSALRSACGISSSRMALVPYAAEVLGQVVREFKPKDIAISSYGLREGLLYEQMPESLRARDPLLEACRFAEAKDARVPGFGATLFGFVRPLFPTASPARLRLIEAACLLHDVSWRAHPDYRAEICFDNATRANLGGLEHSERVFLGLALLHRYTNRRAGTRFDAMQSLVSEKDLDMAEVLGKAMRLGAMLWIGHAQPMAHFTWQPRKKRLELALSPAAMPLFGEVAQARLNSLASSLKASVKLRTL